MTVDVKMTLGTDGLYDLTVDPATGDFTTEDSFDSAILYSFFGERRATQAEVPAAQYRRGWIGNETQDYENGSKVWLLEQSRLTRNNLNRLATEAFNGWNWFLSDNILQDITVETTFNGVGEAGLNVSFVRFDSIVDQKFFAFWDNTGTVL